MGGTLQRLDGLIKYAGGSSHVCRCVNICSDTGYTAARVQVRLLCCRLGLGIYRRMPSSLGQRLPCKQPYAGLLSFLSRNLTLCFLETPVCRLILFVVVAFVLLYWLLAKR